MHAARAWIAGSGLCAVLLLAFILYRLGPFATIFPECFFHRFTGLDCPGCGMTRAVHAALHGRLAEAFRFNPVGIFLFPAALLGIGLELIGWVRGKPLPFRFRAGGRWGWGIAITLLVFWVLRNIPVWPCTLLSPP
jgi:hypothetical protein